MSNGVIVLGQNLRYLFANYFPENKIHVIPNGGNYPFYPNENKSNTLVKIIYLGNLQSTKGIEDVLNAIAIVQQQLPDKFSMQVVGEWRNNNTKEKCYQLVEKNKLPVQFLAPVSGKNKFELLSGSDIFIFTPREPEGHPWVIIEAMAAGLPVISTNQGAIIESITDGENGFIVPANNPVSIASKLFELIQNDELRKTMGRKSREIYLDRFTEDIMVSNYINSFDSVINYRTK